MTMTTRSPLKDCKDCCRRDLADPYFLFRQAECALQLGRTREADELFMFAVGLEKALE